MATKKQNKTKNLKVRLTLEEWNWLKVRADQYAKGSKSQFVRDCFTTFRPKMKKPPGIAT